MDDLTTAAMGVIHGSYPPPRFNVLLLTCMDLRLIDELAAFMDRDNLTNRYDHLVFAGASLGVMHSTKKSWKKTFFDHLAIAVELHEPHDIYIVEHRHCGAYDKLLGLTYDESQQDEEKHEHATWATKLKEEIEVWWRKHNPKDRNGKPIPVRIHGFLMDLRGDVELLDLAPRPRPTRRARRTSEA